MLAVIHHINSPKLKQYPSDVIGMAKNKIRQKEASLLHIVEGSLTQDQKLQFVDALYSVYGGDTYLKAYNNILCDILNQALKAEFKNIDEATEAIFGKNNEKYALTNAFSGVSGSSHAEILTIYDNLIANLRNSFSFLFPDKNLSSAGNSDFFKELIKVFEGTKSTPESKTSLSELVTNLETLGAQYAALFSDNGTVKTGTIDKRWLERTTGALQKFIGVGFWELVTMKAGEQAFKKMDVLKVIKQMMEKSIGPVKSIEVVGARQTGAEKSGNKSMVADSMVDIKIVSSDNKVSVVVSTGDTTKMSQSLATRGRRKESGGTKIKSISEQILGGVLKEIDNSLYEYWERRMSPFLTENNTRLNSTVENWNNTLQAIKIMSAFDAIAVRIGGGVQSLSFNTKRMCIRAIAELSATANPNGANYISLSGLSSITNTSKGGKYSSYISDQYKDKPRGDNPDDPERHQERYNSFIKGIMDTKFKASVNVLAVSRNM